jgi:hypothetical protein
MPSAIEIPIENDSDLHPDEEEKKETNNESASP